MLTKTMRVALMLAPALLAPSALAVIDTFSGGFRTDLPWTWDVPGRVPLSSYDGAHTAFSSKSLDIDFGPFMWQSFNTPANIASLPIISSDENWEVSVDLTPRFSRLDQGSNPYGGTGLVFMHDADNYVHIYIGRNGAEAGINFAGEQFGTWFWGWSPGGAPWSDSDVYTLKVLRIIPADMPQAQFDFHLYKNGEPVGTQGGYQWSFRYDANDPNNFFYNMFADLSGKRVGVYTDAAGNFDSSGTPKTVSFMNFHTNLRIPGSKRVSGVSTLQDLSSGVAIAGYPLECLVYSGSTLKQAESVSLDKDGNFAFTTTLPAGTYDLFLKTDTFLRRKLTLTVGAGDTSGLSTSLVNGDIDGDDSVTVFDYTSLSDAFDTVAGDPNYVLAADLDKDGAVTVFDYSILSNNFDMSGDPLP